MEQGSQSVCWNPLQSNKLPQLCSTSVFGDKDIRTTLVGQREATLGSMSVYNRPIWLDIV